MNSLRHATLFTAIATVALAPVFAQNGVESNLPGAGFDTPQAHPAANGAAAPTIRVYSRETIVDVTVTDADGKPSTASPPPISY